MIRWLTASLFLMAAACGGGGGEPLPPPSFDTPVLGADGSLSGVTGVDGRHWSLVDRDLRSGVFWYSVVDSLTKQCPATFPEHEDWLGEVNLLLQRASGQATRTAIEMERERLAGIAQGADRATTALNAMAVAEVDIPGLVRGWIRRAAGAEVSDGEAWIKGCGMLFDKESLRGLLRNSAEPLGEYFDRMQADHPDIYQSQNGVEGIARRLKKV